MRVFSSFFILVLPSFSASLLTNLGNEVLSPRPRMNPKARVEFGTSVALSANWKRLLTGTPHYDYKHNSNFSEDESNKKGGGVFYYELDDDYKIWNLKWGVYGNANATEPRSIGEFISLSPSGNLAAIHFGTHVQVYVTTHGMPLGDPIFDSKCTNKKGSHLEVKERYLVVSCYSFRNSTGKVDVYQLDRNSKSWESVISIYGEDGEGSRYGWRMALDETATSGNRWFRLAISAPNSRQNTGLVRVIDVFDDGLVKQVGEAIFGSEEGGLFGFDLSMSETSDSILAISAPQSSVDSRESCADLFKYISMHEHDCLIHVAKK